jgi:hypothetical protein
MLIYLPGASLASMATSSPMAVKTMTSAAICKYLVTNMNSLVLTCILLLGLEQLLDLLANFTFWDLDIVLGSTVVGHQGQETVIGDIKLARVLA